jgi:hypothetical protein
MHGIADLNAERELEIRKAEYLNRSRYGHTVEQYRRVFPHTQLLIVDFQQYTADPEGSMATVFEFLGLSPGAAPSTSARNTSTGSNRSQWSPIYYVDRILAYSPPFLRRLLSKYISVKLAKRPEFPVQLQQQLYRELEPDITLFESLNGSPMPAWREGRAG